MTLPAPRALLVDHPALGVPIPSDRGIEVVPGGRVASARLSRRQRVRLAAQLVAAASTLADFDLWLGRRAIADARFVENDGGLQAVVVAVPRDLSRLWRRLGGGEEAADATRQSVLGAVSDVTGLPRTVVDRVPSGPGFFFGPQLTSLLGELPLPLDAVTARNLWAVRWSPPAPLDEGEVAYWSVSDPWLAARFAAALWCTSWHSGLMAWLWRVGDGEERTGPLPEVSAAGTLVVCGRLGESELEAVARWVRRPGCSGAAIGAFPEGWRPPPPPGFDAGRLAAHLALSGLPADLCRLEIERRADRFDPLGEDDRGSLTEAARWLWRSPPVRERVRAHPPTLRRLLGLLPEGLPEGFVLVNSGLSLPVLKRQAEDLSVVFEGDRWRLPSPLPLVRDPLHLEVAQLFAAGDPRRLRHEALADGSPGPLVEWASDRLSQLDGSTVRKLLRPIGAGELGAAVQALLVESCLCELDLGGARRALEELAELDARLAVPWRRWLEVLDAPTGYRPGLPQPEEEDIAPRACAEVALHLLLRAERSGAEPAPEACELLARCSQKLDEAVRNRIEMERAFSGRPQRLADRLWRRRLVAGVPALQRRLAHLRSLQLVGDTVRQRAARRLLILAGMGETSPGRRGFLELDLGFLALDQGRTRVASGHLLRSYRLLEAAGFRNRTRLALFDLAVCDLDLLEVGRARSRLRDLEARAIGSDPFVLGEEVRLALAEGDEAGFRHLLARYPVAVTARDRRFDDNLCMLRGVEAILNGDTASARRLLESGDQECERWLALAGAMDGVCPPDGSEDDWGVSLAARLVWLSGRGRWDEARRSLPLPDQLSPQIGFALALTERILGHQAWLESSLRERVAAVLDQRGLTGWSRALRRGRREDDRLMESLARVVGAGGLDSLSEAERARLIQGLGLSGVEVRSRLDGEVLWSCGGGAPGAATTRGRLVVVPLGGEPASDPAWQLFLGILDLLGPQRSVAAVTPEEPTGVLGPSAAMNRLRNELRTFAPTGIGVLIHGETGVGKEVAARAIHRLSGRPGEFVAVNVSAIPTELLEAELFGSVRGAFTGADRSRRGLVDSADRGTLFLDEIGDLDLSLQVKLLRFLESQEVRPVGSDTSRTVDLRIVCATHRDLRRRIAEGSFRHDLYYRIAAARIWIPPLRDRLEDLPVLRALFEDQAESIRGLARCHWSKEAEALLARHHWPGNVRELRHVVEVAMVRAAGGTVVSAHLPIEPDAADLPRRWDDAVASFRRRFLASALRRNRGNRSATARELGISRQALLYHIRQLGLGDDGG